MYTYIFMHFHARTQYILMSFDNMYQDIYMPNLFVVIIFSYIFLYFFYFVFCGCGCSEIMENYQKQMKRVAEKVTHIILNLLGISEEEKKWVGSDKGLQALQLNSYPCCPDPNRAMGLGPHTDTSFLTILHQAQTQSTQTHQGLQIFNEAAGWVPVHPHPGALVVHAGDLLHVISNARFRSVLHRATVNGTRQRYSFAYFYGPPQDYVLSPVPVDSETVARFRAVTVKDFVSIKAQNPRHALSSISI